MSVLKTGKFKKHAFKMFQSVALMLANLCSRRLTHESETVDDCTHTHTPTGGLLFLISELSEQVLL